MTLQAKSPRILGRERELEAFSDLVALSSNGGPGRGGGVLIEGEAGIGKSTLLRALVGIADERGWFTITPSCNESDQIRQFGALLDVLDCRLQHLDLT